MFIIVSFQLNMTLGKSNRLSHSLSPLQHFSSFWSPCLPSTPSNQILKSVDPLNNSQGASVQHFPSEEINLPCLLSWKGSFLSLAAGAALLLGFVKAKPPLPLSNIAAIYCHTLPTWVTRQNVFWQPPTPNPTCLWKNLWIYFPWMKELIQKTSTNVQLQLIWRLLTKPDEYRCWILNLLGSNPLYHSTEEWQRGSNGLFSTKPWGGKIMYCFHFQRM